jgi:phage repressor protein C with HTH and peptisase S24 domain
LAARNGLSASGLARRAGLDPTTFNKSKRTSPDGRLRWPSTESIAKILEATNTDLEVFMSLINAELQTRPSKALPLINLGEIREAFDAEGRASGEKWDEIAFPELPIDNVFAIEVVGDSLTPTYREGDILVCSSSVPVRRGDRVLVRNRQGDMAGGVLRRKTISGADITPFNRGTMEVTFGANDIVFVARILWASQ